MSEYSLHICHLYPDLLNLYGDTGNVICLSKRLEWRGIGCEVTGLSVGDALDPDKYDLFFIGGGQDFEEDALLKDAAESKREGIAKAIADDKVLLAIGIGYQLLGKYKTPEGETVDYMNVLDICTEATEERFTGDYMFTCEELPGETIIGFENHAGKTYLGKDVAPIGKVLAGNGNNGEDGTEGARYRNAYGSYAYGPLLPKNPAFCDLLLAKALERKYGSVDLAPLKDEYELEAHRVIEARFQTR